MGRLTLNVLLSFAQFEREVTSERIRDKIAASKLIVGRSHAAPQGGRNSRRLDPDVIDMNVREGIRRFGRPRHRIGVEAVLE
jgi:DNA invertase Pin-like site-specific DNA recombinase